MLSQWSYFKWRVKGVNEGVRLCVGLMLVAGLGCSTSTESDQSIEVLYCLGLCWWTDIESETETTSDGMGTDSGDAGWRGDHRSEHMVPDAGRVQPSDGKGEGGAS